MHSKDLYCGIVLIALGGWIAWEASGFPALAGMAYGAGLFPTIAAVGMCLCGAFIVLSALIMRYKAIPPQADDDVESNGFRGVANTIVVIVVVVLYALFLNTLGFHLVSFLALFSLFLVLQVRWLTSLILAVGVTVTVHFIFYSLLHVPLPWGIVERFAW